jgi:hypothetical protein
VLTLDSRWYSVGSADMGLGLPAAAEPAAPLAALRRTAAARMVYGVGGCDGVELD